MRSRGKNIDNLRSVYQRAHDDDDDDEVETRFASPSMRKAVPAPHMAPRPAPPAESDTLMQCMQEIV